MATTSETPFTPAGFPISHTHRVHHQIHQPPKQSPLNSTNTSNDYFSTARSRKRQRPGSLHDDSLQQTPWTATPSWAQCPTPSDGMYMSSATVNEKYCLAGGFDTPGLIATSGYDQKDGDSFMRRARHTNACGDAAEAIQDGGRTDIQHLCGPLARERNGVPRMRSSPNGEQLTSQGWASYAFELAGKFFAFGTGMIRGFYPSGVNDFDFDQQSLSDSWTHSRPPLQRRRRGSTPVPGSWQEEFLGDFEQDNPNSPTFSNNARPPNKRRQTDKDSWVLVGRPEATVELSPKRKSTNVHRASLNPSVASRPSGASRANSRRSLLPVSSRRQSSYISQNGSPAHFSTATPPHPASPHHQPGPEVPMQKSGKRASIAPTRSTHTSSRPSSASDPQSSTYISPETAKLLKRQAKQEKAADKAMSSMSRRLEDLIRQGQEALGTKVHVDVDFDETEREDVDVEMEMDEGFVDEEW